MRALLAAAAAVLLFAVPATASRTSWEKMTRVQREHVVRLEIHRGSTAVAWWRAHRPPFDPFAVDPTFCKPLAGRAPAGICARARALPHQQTLLARMVGLDRKEEAAAARREALTLREQGSWLDAVTAAQAAYPGTSGWLMSCSSSEGGWGRWVSNYGGSGAGGWMQFLEGTFWRMYGDARAELTGRGYVLPASSASWYSPLGQALAGAWGVTHGHAGEWFGGGC